MKGFGGFEVRALGMGVDGFQIRYPYWPMVLLLDTGS